MKKEEIERLRRQAVAGLGIDVPVMATRVVGERLELSLYGGRVVLFPDSPPEDQPAPAAPKKTRRARK